MRFFARRAAYEVLPPPYPLDFDHWTAGTAQDYLQWYTAHIPERAAYVYRRALGKPLPDGPIDPEALTGIWAWFLKTAKTEPVPEERRREGCEKFGRFGDTFLSETRFTVLTEFILRDIAMFISLVFTTNHPSLYWDTVQTPKRHVNFQQPVLKGFLNARYGKPFAAAFQPDHMVSVQAAKLLPDHGKISAAERDLVNLYRLWEQDIPG